MADFADVLSQVIGGVDSYFDAKAAANGAKAAEDLRKAAEIEASNGKSAGNAWPTVPIAGQDVPVFYLVAGGIGLVTLIWIVKG